MVFRKDNKADAFQRQIGALRHQLGGESGRENSALGAPYPEERRDAVVETGLNLRNTGFGTREAAGFSLGGFGGGQVSPPIVEPVSPLAPRNVAPTIDEQTSVIAHDATWKGDLQTSGTFHVHGRLEGSISAKQDIFIAEEAEVDATIAGVNVIIAGLVRGSIRCEGRFEVLPQGRVTGDVQAPTLVIHEGAIINGQFRMDTPESATTELPAPPKVLTRRAARGGD